MSRCPSSPSTAITTIHQVQAHTPPWICCTGQPAAERLGSNSSIDAGERAKSATMRLLRCLILLSVRLCVPLSCSLLNYFGKIERVDHIVNYPILITKGDSKLALYGMGNVRDERLHRTFEMDGVKWSDRGNMETGDGRSRRMLNLFFSLSFACVCAGTSRSKIHLVGSISQSCIRIGQFVRPAWRSLECDRSVFAHLPLFALLLFFICSTRHTQTQRDYLPEKFLPSWLDMVIWFVERALNS